VDTTPLGSLRGNTNLINQNYCPLRQWSLSSRVFEINEDMGPSIKYVTLEGGGVRVGLGVIVCDREGQEHVTSHF